MNYLIYPLKFMNITQTYRGGTSHGPHNTGSPKDYPIDDGAENTGQSYFYCPCDEVEIVRLYTSGTNTIWIQSTAKVDFASGASDFMTMQITHVNDDQMRKLYVGQRFKRKQQMFLEGSDGATANHFHISVGQGKIKGNGWVLNSNNKWVLTTINGTYMPENAFYIDTSFTKIINSAGLAFKSLQSSGNSTGGTDMTRGYFAKGDANEGVYAYKQLIIALKKAGIIGQGVDDNNIFGDGTYEATKQIQAKAGIERDGYAGPITIRACYTLLESKL